MKNMKKNKLLISVFDAIFGRLFLAFEKVIR